MVTVFVFWKMDYLCIRELFDSIAPQNAEIRTVPQSLLANLKYSVKWLFLR